MTPEDLRKHKGTSFVGVTASFFCHDGKGRFYLARRSQKARDEQGTWDPGGGGVKFGETVEESIRREVKEEYGADAKELEFLGYDDAFRKLADGTPTHWIAMRFAVLVDPTQVKICEPDVLTEGGWFTREALPEPLHSMFPAFLAKYKKQLDRILGS
jgi:ADP-ribose pyrophosphatase YjhB (NUDIX family)